MNKKIKEKIRKWIVESIRFKEYEPSGCHLHIDDFDVSLRKDTSMYFYKGIEFLTYANEILKELKLPFYVDLSISFNPTKKKRQILKFKNVAEFAKDIFSTPSIYLYHKNDPSKKDIKGKKLTNKELNFLPNDIKCLYSDIIDQNDLLHYEFFIFYINGNFFKVKS
jgi:hypothetical protein